MCALCSFGFNLHLTVCVKQKETAPKSSALQPSALKDKEPASWRWDKQELERQVRDWKKKYDELVQSSTDTKKDKDKVTLKPVKFGSASTAVINHSFVFRSIFCLCNNLQTVYSNAFNLIQFN